MLPPTYFLVFHQQSVSVSHSFLPLDQGEGVGGYPVMRGKKNVESRKKDERGNDKEKEEIKRKNKKDKLTW